MILSVPYVPESMVLIYPMSVFKHLDFPIMVYFFLTLFYYIIQRKKSDK